MTATPAIASLRPGVALGDYPEKTPLDTAWPDKLAERLLRVWKPLSKKLQRSQLRAFVRLVDKEAATLDLQADDACATLASDLQQRFSREGLTDRLVARSFALVRAAAELRLGLRHYNVQLMAGRVMLEGGLAEMETGEGKTLAATLPACTAALAGIPVHIVTANDYLVTRDAAAMGPVYRALGLTVGAITEKSTPEMRRNTYARNIAYNTSKQLAFDYLRDRIAMRGRSGAVQLRVERLYNEQAAIDQVMMRGLCFAIVDEADSILIDEARTPFIIANERDTTKLEEQCSQALYAARLLDDTKDFVLDRRRCKAEVTESGRAAVKEMSTALPQNTRLRVALVEQALGALLLFQRDRDYLVRDDRIEIIDPHTGRVMADRSWNRGLHQMIELKEGCPITATREPLASLTFQRFFRRYLRLAGMTGTAHEVRDELWSTYRMPVVRLDTHKPRRRQRLPNRANPDSDKKWQSIVARIVEINATERPVLVGTRSVSDSEQLSALLDQAGLKHELLNARQDAEEARIVACAGQSGQITLATNMAGRGTDIALAPGVIELGGLHVIAVEKNDARRLDRQLFGRCGRHGEPGSCEVFHSLDDEVVKRFFPEWLAGLLKALSDTGIGRVMLIAGVAVAQRQCERRHRNDRRGLAIMQDQIDRLLSFSGQPE